MVALVAAPPPKLGNAVVAAPLLGLLKESNEKFLYASSPFPSHWLELESLEGFPNDNAPSKDAAPSDVVPLPFAAAGVPHELAAAPVPLLLAAAGVPHELAGVPQEEEAAAAGCVAGVVAPKADCGVPAFAGASAFAGVPHEPHADAGLPPPPLDSDNSYLFGSVSVFFYCFCGLGHLLKPLALSRALALFRVLRASYFVCALCLLWVCVLRGVFCLYAVLLCLEVKSTRAI